MSPDLRPDVVNEGWLASGKPQSVGNKKGWPGAPSSMTGWEKSVPCKSRRLRRKQSLPFNAGGDMYGSLLGLGPVGAIKGGGGHISMRGSSVASHIHWLGRFSLPERSVVASKNPGIPVTVKLFWGMAEGGGYFRRFPSATERRSGFIQNRRGPARCGTVCCASSAGSPRRSQWQK